MHSLSDIVRFNFKFNVFLIGDMKSTSVDVSCAPTPLHKRQADGNWSRQVSAVEQNSTIFSAASKIWGLKFSVFVCLGQARVSGSDACPHAVTSVLWKDRPVKGSPPDEIMNLTSPLFLVRPCNHCATEFAAEIYFDDEGIHMLDWQIGSE